ESIANSAAEKASEQGTVNATTHENSNGSKWSNQLITCDKNSRGEVFLHKSIEKNTVIPHTYFRIDDSRHTTTNPVFITHAHKDHVLKLKDDCPVFATEETHKIISIDRKNASKNGIIYGPVKKMIVSDDELIVLLYVSKEQKEGTQKKQEAAVESFINDKYKSYIDGKVKYYHTDAIKESTDPKKPIRIVTVRAFNAHHCPGSCMFLFEMFEGSGDHLDSFFSMFHTGDFRYNENMEKDFKNLKNPIPNLTLLHVDDTCYYRNDKGQMYRTLTKDEAIENIRQLIKARQKDNIKCYEFQLHRIEKSEIWREIAMEMKTPVFLYG
ncbi:hypothetical protein WA577_000452, partial [Blastocystis sp. JDR]